MSSIVSRWVVREAYPVCAEDLGADGTVSVVAVERWIASVLDVYLERCSALCAAADGSGRVLNFDLSVLDAVPYGRPTTVVVSAGTTEVYPTSFTMAFRVRTYGGADDVVVNATCAVSIRDPDTGEAGEIDDAIRDELIALEHAARHTN